MAPLFVALSITEAIDANITVNTTVTTGPNGSSADSNDSYWKLSLSLFLIGTAVTIVIVICTVAFSTLAHKQPPRQRIRLVLPQRLPVSMPEVQSTQFFSTQGIQVVQVPPPPRALTGSGRENAAIPSIEYFPDTGLPLVRMAQVIEP